MFPKNWLKLNGFVYSLYLTHTFGMELHKPDMNEPSLSQSLTHGGGTYSSGTGGIDTVNYIRESSYNPTEKHINGNNPLSDA